MTACTISGFVILGIVFLGIVLLAIRDLTQKKHAILRNFPVLGHARYFLEMLGPELRQYIVARDDEERPFNRDQRSWIYASSKRENNYFGFGTDNDLELTPNYLILKHSAFPLPDLRPGVEGYDDQYRLPCAKVIGKKRNRKKAFRPNSVVNVSAMSYGSLSAPAVEAINRGCGIAGALHNTGEGGVAKHHDHGGDLVWQLGTGYFGARAPDGNFDLKRFKDVVAKFPNLKAIEVKLSQGAKPGLGGMLPGEKVTPEIAEARGIPVGKDCASPSYHRAFSDIDSMLDFVEMLADESGLPVGIKSAVGDVKFWSQLAEQMSKGDRGVDFVAIDGGEGGTGAAPLTFSDYVSLPFKVGFVRAFGEFVKFGIQHDTVFIGSGKLGFPESALVAFCLGCDMVNVAREPMMAIGCIQAQKCHTGHCPTGVATQNKWLMRGLDPTSKGARLANYIITLRKEMIALSRACGVPHPAMLTADKCEILDDKFQSRSLAEIFDFKDIDRWGIPHPDDCQEIEKLMSSYTCDHD